MKPNSRQKPDSVTVGVVRLAHARALELPAYQSSGAAGMDLVAAIGARKTIDLAPGERALVPTGLALEIPAGYEAQIRPRSGLALRHGVTVLNSPGTIDADYRGEVKVILINLGESSFVIEHGARIAQMVVAPVTRAKLAEAAVLGASRRGAGGFGSTGTAAPKPARKTKRSGPKTPKKSSADVSAKAADKSPGKRPSKKTKPSRKRKTVKPKSKPRRART